MTAPDWITKVSVVRTVLSRTVDEGINGVLVTVVVRVEEDSHGIEVPKTRDGLMSSSSQQNYNDALVELDVSKDESALHAASWSRIALVLVLRSQF